MKIELTIKTNYLPNWGAYEGIRELVQNGQDAKTEFGASFDVTYRKDASTLVLTNDGCTLPHEALLFGHTSKDGRGDLIGKFGEGLKLGVLALVRSEHAVKIRSGSEVWVPAIERSERFNADVLVFNIASGREQKNRVQVEIGNVSEGDWEAMAEKEGRIELAKGVLADRKETLAVLVHETAHKLGGGDGEIEHVRHIEGLWSAIVEKMSA